MIVIELTKCKFSLKTNEYTFHKNHIYIGSNFSADLYINDSNIFTNQFYLEIIENRLLIHPHRSLGFYLVDGKRTTSRRYLKVGQRVSFDENEFIIKNFIEVNDETFREKLNTNTDKIISNNPDILKIIKKIEEQSQDDAK